jgi:hypothetical protein
MSLESDGGIILTGENRRTRRKTCPSATLSTTNPTWTDQGANPGLLGDRPATNDLSHGTVTTCVLHLLTCSLHFISKLEAAQSVSPVNHVLRVKALRCERVARRKK